MTVSSSADISTIRWEIAEQNKILDEFTRSYVGLSSMGKSKLLTASKSALFGTYGVECSLRQLIDWQNFHRAWIYRFSANATVPSVYQMPNPWLVRLMIT